MGDCICGARGIDLDGHECVPSLKAENQRLRAEVEQANAEIERGLANRMATVHYCTEDCHGYNKAPLSVDLWPGESKSEEAAK